MKRYKNKVLILVVLLLVSLPFDKCIYGQGMGVGVSTPANTLDVEGNMAVGVTYSGTTAAPVNGLIIEGTTGIGTTGPARKLDILDASNPQLRLTHTDGAVYTDFQTTFAGHLYLNPSGARVGIGTSVPERVLHISNSGNDLLMLHSTAGGDGNRANLDFMTYQGGTTIYPTGRISAIDNNWSSHLAFLTKIPGADANGLVERARLTNDGNFGIGINSPSTKLHVYSNIVGNPSNNYGLIIENASGEAEILLNPGSTGPLYNISADDNGEGLRIFENAVERFRIYPGGNVGIGIVGAPTAILHARRTTSGKVFELDCTNDDIDFRMGESNGDYGFYWRYAGTGTGDANYLKLVSENATGVDFDIFSIGHSTSGMDIYGGYASTGITIAQNGDFTSSGSVAIGTATLTNKLNVEASGATVARFNRTVSDGTILSLQQDGIEEGTITVSGATISYNAFTGSHYAWTEQSIQKGMLVTLTGNNQYFHNNKDSEIIYGIQTSTKPNDPKIMGAFLGIQESALPYSVNNPNLVMAVGNGVMWVADKGENLEAGDYLISSDIPGYAMKDDGTYATSFVIARVAEPVDWSAVSATANGLKYKLVSVFFESFVRNNAEKELARTKVELHELRERITEIEKRMGVVAIE